MQWIAPLLPRAGVLNHLATNVLVKFETAERARVEAYILTFARMKKDGETFDTPTMARSVDRFERRAGRGGFAGSGTTRCRCARAGAVD